MSLLTDLQERVDMLTAEAKLVSNHTRPEDPESWRKDNNPGREATYLEGIVERVKHIFSLVEQLNCEGDWCGKSPNKDSDGLCGSCGMKKDLFIDRLKGL